MSGICIIGLGSPHGDDQAGWELVRLLENEAVPASVADQLRFCVSAAADGAVLELWRDADLAIIVDAMRSDAPPGTVRRIELDPHGDPSLLREVRTLSSHGLDLPGFLALASALDGLPQRLILFGVEIGACAPFEPLSAPVRAALPALARAIRAEVDSRR